MTAVERDLLVLRSQLQGHLIPPDDMEYEAARRVWNGMIDKRPRAIARCAGAADVAAVVQFAEGHGLPVSVRGGGHGVAGNAVCDDGLVIDLSPMKEIRVDREHRFVRAGGGVVWGEFDAETQTYGLATTGGLVSTTGIAGLTLGGGLGYLMRSYGLACDNLVSIAMVTAGGERLIASQSENQDLFWAVRGGGGNFGIVTAFAFQLYAVGPLLLAGPVEYPLAQAGDVLRSYRDWSLTAPDEVSVYATLSTAADGSPRVVLQAVYNGSLETATSVLDPLRHFGAPILDDIRPRHYVEIQRMVDVRYPPGRLNYWKANFLDQLGDELIDVVVDAYSRVPSPFSVIDFEPMGGAVARIGAMDTAFSHRHAAFSLLLLGRWDDPMANEANIAWVRELWQRTQPLSSAGVYVNYLGTEGDERIRAAYGANYDRLVAVKQRYDPHNVFRLNQNIPPVAVSRD
jgi:FAD/FMN-containing dehydrogenase